MVDFVRAVAIIFAFVGSVRARSALGIGCACVLAYFVAADLASLVASSERALPSVHAAFGAIFLGPTALPGRGAAFLPLSGVIGAHPLAVRVLTAIGAAAMLVRAHRASARLRPESDDARVLDAMALPFLGIALLDTAQVVLVLTWIALD